MLRHQTPPGLIGGKVQMAASNDLGYVEANRLLPAYRAVGMGTGTTRVRVPPRVPARLARILQQMRRRAHRQEGRSPCGRALEVYRATKCSTRGKEDEPLSLRDCPPCRWALRLDLREDR